ncbi:MAG TPA: hypothetical protein VIK54_15175 [Acidimicrobiia bacterium]
MLAFDDVDRQAPQLPWRADELERVLDALHELAIVLTPSPIPSSTIRCDNVLLTSDRVFVVDWPWAAVGAPWLDLVAMLPSVAMQGGPRPDDVWRAHPLNRGVDDERVDSFIAALAGLFVHDSLFPPPPGIPNLRAFQAGQGERAIAWLASPRRTRPSRSAGLRSMEVGVEPRRLGFTHGCRRLSFDEGPELERDAPPVAPGA